MNKWQYEGKKEKPSNPRRQGIIRMKLSVFSVSTSITLAQLQALYIWLSLDPLSLAHYGGDSATCIIVHCLKQNLRKKIRKINDSKYALFISIMFFMGFMVYMLQACHHCQNAIYFQEQTKIFHHFSLHWRLPSCIAICLFL